MSVRSWPSTRWPVHRPSAASLPGTGSAASSSTSRRTRLVRRSMTPSRPPCRTARCFRTGGDQGLAAPWAQASLCPRSSSAGADRPQFLSRHRRVPARPAGHGRQRRLRARRAPGGNTAGERDQPGPGPVLHTRGLARRALPGRNTGVGRRRCRVHLLLSPNRGRPPRRRHLGRVPARRCRAGTAARLHHRRRGTRSARRAEGSLG